MYVLHRRWARAFRESTLALLTAAWMIGAQRSRRPAGAEPAPAAEQR